MFLFVVRHPEARSKRREDPEFTEIKNLMIIKKVIKILLKPSIIFLEQHNSIDCKKNIMR